MTPGCDEGFVPTSTLIRIADTLVRDPANPCPDPRVFARQLGLPCVQHAIDVCDGVVAFNDRIVFRGSPDRRVWGLRIYHGIAHALLARSGATHCELDVLRLTEELVAPSRYIDSAGAELLPLAQAYAPVALVESIIADRREASQDAATDVAPANDRYCCSQSLTGECRLHGIFATSCELCRIPIEHAPGWCIPCLHAFDAPDEPGRVIAFRRP